MKLNRKSKLSLKPLLFFTFAFFIMTACGLLSSPKIIGALLTKDSNSGLSTSVFAPADTIYLVVDAGGPDETKVKASWTVVNAENFEPNTLIDEIEKSISGNNEITFDLTSSSPWPVGDYKVVLSLNGDEVQTLTYKVQNPLGQGSPSGETAFVETPTPGAVVTTSGPVLSLDAVKSATIQIEAQGTFTDPEVGKIYNAAGRGSGFIIDPSGIAVTNNHVVTGAALLKVWVGGETTPRNARVLGVSECADLAVIDIDGENFPYLDWYQGNIDVGLDVYAAGFPLGNPEFTLTRGIVSKARTGGESGWASVDNVIEHDATINPGNSGGPLITLNGQIVAINYAGASETNQYYAIAQAQALPVIDQLRQGKDYLSIGVNGTAINDGEGLSGIWVSSVKSGSQADKAGIVGGDIITRMEGLILALDGSMADYCDILRSHGPEDTLSVEVLRFSSQEVLAGQLNGRVLEQSFSFAQVLDEVAGGTSTDGSAYSEYVSITDDSGNLTLDVPVNWSQIDGSAWELDGQIIGLSVTAAPNLDDYYNSWTTPGVFFGATDQFDVTIEELLDVFDFSGDCTYSDRTDYQDSAYIGRYDIWLNCGGTGTLLVVLAAEPSDRSYLTLVLVQVVSDADLTALDNILATFIVSP